ncbi:MAG: 16S rRNA (guanine(527)-N(7))-methyltransferase RsmG [Bacteroidia bacterium]|nr:16S rRNA (guanine(527)-N(7))-methyltransferase RsmG [Bacteroidia bacterium]
MQSIAKYFPDISHKQQRQFAMLEPLYSDWNLRINVISRKDIENLYIRHCLHSLAIAKVLQFKKETTIMDVGTGGGFPGIPLAILFPDTKFYLIDSVGKKIKVVKTVAESLELSNIEAESIRVENVRKQFDFVISRAVTSFPDFVKLTRKNISHIRKNSLPNGILYLKGGDFTEEIIPFKKTAVVYNISDYFTEDFFKTKKIIYLQI